MDYSCISIVVHALAIFMRSWVFYVILFMPCVLFLFPQAFSANGENTVETTNPLYQRTIGQRVQLSFADIKIINLAYCASKFWIIVL